MLLTRLAPRADEIPPLVRGIGPLPRPARFYFHFGRSIDSAPMRVASTKRLCAWRCANAPGAPSNAAVFARPEMKAFFLDDLRARQLGQARSAAPQR